MKDDILKKCQPTYFNVLKSMYPLLADAFELNSHIFKSEAEAGRKIGYYDFSLEKVIQEARTNYPEGSETCRLANLMENKIRSKTDPAYFGTWK